MCQRPLGNGHDAFRLSSEENEKGFSIYSMNYYSLRLGFFPSPILQDAEQKKKRREKEKQEINKF